MGLPTVPDTTPGVVPLWHAVNANTNNRMRRKNAFEIRMTTGSYLSGSQIAARRRPLSASRLSIGSKGILTLYGAQPKPVRNCSRLEIVRWLRPSRRHLS
jgi:hypothetical protein